MQATGLIYSAAPPLPKKSYDFSGPLFLLSLPCSVLTHSCCGLLTPCFGGTLFRTIGSFAAFRKALAEFFADGQRLRLEHGLQLRLGGQQIRTELPAQCAVGEADTEHIALTRRRKLCIARFRANTKSSLTPLLLLSPKSLVTFRGPDNGRQPYSLS